MKYLDRIANITLGFFSVWLSLPYPAFAQQTDSSNRKLVRLEAEYILQSQYWSDNPNDCASGAINNVYDATGKLAWIVPRENALAILGLVRASQALHQTKYLERAQASMDYLLRIQDSDGGWFNQYQRCQPSSNSEGQSKSPTQTAEVMIALHQLGYQPSRYPAMLKAAEFLLTLQDPSHKKGLDDGLIGGGIYPDLSPSCDPYCPWRWTHDNSFAYQALQGAALWAGKADDSVRQERYEAAASRILGGINQYLKDPNTPVWHLAVDEQGRAICLRGGKGDRLGYGLCESVSQPLYEWINYAPQMLNVPAQGVGDAAVGEWIQQTFVDPKTGAIARMSQADSLRFSPGYSFMANLVWLDLGQRNYYHGAWIWANTSGLHQQIPDYNGVKGGWIDWTERADGTGECAWHQQPNDMAQCWERFIDTSFYAIAAATGGFDFSPTD